MKSCGWGGAAFFLAPTGSSAGNMTSLVEVNGQIDVKIDPVMTYMAYELNSDMPKIAYRRVFIQYNVSLVIRFMAVQFK